MNKIQKTMSVIAAIVLLVSVAMISFAFKADKSMSDPITYTYNNATNAGTLDPNNWTPGDLSSCTTPGLVPCKVTFDQDVYADITIYLSQFTDEAAVAFGSGVSRKL